MVERDSKGLYAKFNRGEIAEVAGMDIDFKKPEKADLVIKNIKSKESLLNYAEAIIEKLLVAK